MELNKGVIFIDEKKHEHIIQSVRPGSIAEELGIEPGDILLEIDGQVIEDIFDYQFLCGI